MTLMGSQPFLLAPPPSCSALLVSPLKQAASLKPGPGHKCSASGTHAHHSPKGKAGKRGMAL